MMLTGLWCLSLTVAPCHVGTQHVYVGLIVMGKLADQEAGGIFLHCTAMAMMKVGNVGSTTPVWLLTSLPYYCFVTVIQLSTSELWSKLGQSEVRWCNTLYEATTSNLRMCVYVRDCARACVHVQYVCVQ